MFTKLFDQYFQWWQNSATRYLEMFTYDPFVAKGLAHIMERYLEAKKIWDRMLEEMWRNLGIPPLEEVIRIHERLNLIESRCVGLEEHDESRETAILEDLKALKEALEAIRHQMPHS